MHLNFTSLVKATRPFKAWNNLLYDSELLRTLPTKIEKTILVNKLVFSSKNQTVVTVPILMLHQLRNQIETRGDKEYSERGPKFFNHVQ